MSTARARATGLAGVVGIVLIVAGAPALLLAIGATPFPNGVPSWNDVVTTLSGVDDGTATLALFRLAAWAAWAYLAAGLLLEITWRARGITAPRIRGLELSQSVGRALVSAAVLLFTAVPVATIATPAAAAPLVHAAAPAHLPTSETASDSVGAREASAKTALVEEAPVPVTVHTVRPGETLWAIAERYFGDGARYAEIADANYGARQPDGTALTSSHWIRPGWTLTIPAPDTTDEPAASGEEYTVRPGDTLWDIAADELDDPTRYGEIFQASTHIAQPGGHRLTDPDEISPGWTLHIPTANSAPVVAEPAAAPPAPAEATTDSAPAPPVDDPAEVTPPDVAPAPLPGPDAVAASPSAPIVETTPGGDESSHPGAGEAGQAGDSAEIGSWPVRTAAGVGSLLAAGVVALIAARRATRARNRQPGQATTMPTGETAALERVLRAAADPLGIDAVDRALRGLAEVCARTGQPLPTLRWARLSPSQLDLHLAEPAQLPHPWGGTSDALSWTLHVDHVDEADPEAPVSVPAPYPALVTLGHDLDDGHVLIDLEHIGGLAVVGDHDRTRDVLAALAVELATSAWADDLRVTTVLGHVGLEDALQTGRIRYRPSIGHLLDDLTTRAAADRAALAADGAPDLPHARTTGVAPDAWAPEILLLACPLTDRHRNLLTAIVEDQPRVAVAAVTTDDQVGEWTLTLTDDVALLDPLGLRLQPQRLDPVLYERILELASPTAVDQPDDALTTEFGASDLDEADHSETDATLADGEPASTGTLPTGSDQRDRNVVQPVGQGSEPPSASGGQGSATFPTAGGDTDTVGDIAPAPPAEQTEPIDSREAHVNSAGDGHRPRSQPAPFIRVLGPVTIEHARGSVEQSRRSRLTEYAAYLALHPGATAAAIDEAIWPDRRREDNQTTRHTATSRLRAWLDDDPEGNPYLPVHQGTHYAFLQAVRTDWDDWRSLLPNGPLRASPEDLERALSLVRGRPFDGAHPRRYAWAEPIRRTMIDQIVDAAHELARHQARAGNWRGAEDAVVIGLALDPALERLWRVRILAAHAKDATTAGVESIERLLTVTDDLGGDLEPETEDLLAAIRQGADLTDLAEIVL